MEQNKDELYHYGVPGMRWGERKSRRKGSSKNRRKDSPKDEQDVRKKRIAFGKKVAVTALTGVGAVAVGKLVYEKYITSLVKKALVENL